jgi:hypothetical protein
MVTNNGGLLIPAVGETSVRIKVVENNGLLQAANSMITKHITTAELPVRQQTVRVPREPL